MEIRRVLVTGAGGFVGKTVIRELSRDSQLRIVAVDTRLPECVKQSEVRWIEGDISDRSHRLSAIGDGVDAVIHLASVPGGAAEADPALSQRVNLDATLDLFREVAASRNAPRVIFASSIAVYGSPLPSKGVDDQTPLEPQLIYGAHKAMVETMVAAMSRRGEVNGLSLRLPGIVARPKGLSGLNSAFMSDLFHACREGQPITLPVSRTATLWLMSVSQCAKNIVHALRLETFLFPPARSLALPALHVSMFELVAAVESACNGPSGLVSYGSNEALESKFGRHPPLTTGAADSAGFVHDRDISELVASALSTIDQDAGAAR